MSTITERIFQACTKNNTLQSIPIANDVIESITKAIQAVDPRYAVGKVMHRQGSLLTIGTQKYDLDKIRQVKVIGAGKAARPMLEGVADVLGDRLFAGIIITKHALSPDDQIGPVRILEGSHPIPDEKSTQAAHRMLGVLQNCQADDLVLCLISGGGSALMTAPRDGVNLADLQVLTNDLLACGATINEINTLRKHLDDVKGGGLARLAAPAQLACLILSDVVGNPLEVIASGPTVPDPSTFDDCWRIITHYKLETKIALSIRKTLQAGLAGEIADTLKPGDAAFSRTNNLLVGSNLLAAQAALGAAQRSGYHTLLLTTHLQGEARYAGQMLVAIARQITETGQPLSRPACIAVGGETTVTLTGHGFGGRNLELALAAVHGLHAIPNCLLVTFATDGEDGPTDAAGACVTGETLSRAQNLGLDPGQFLHANDSYHFFDALGDLLKPGPTGTNVNDLTFLWLF